MRMGWNVDEKEGAEEKKRRRGKRDVANAVAGDRRWMVHVAATIGCEIPEFANSLIAGRRRYRDEA